MQEYLVPSATRFRLILQTIATIAILVFVPGNAAKLAAMLVVWAIGFGRISRAELVLMIGVNLLFLVMNYGALQKGVFRFNHPDFLGMPVYEFFMWGFYTVLALRFLSGSTPQGKLWVAIALAVAFSIPFSTIGDSGMLTLVTAVILIAGLVLYHEPLDFAYVAFMVALGAMFEYSGVWSGQWSYPGNPPGGVPLWFITMWGGVGLFTRRLLLPALRRNAPSAPAS